MIWNKNELKKLKLFLKSQAYYLIKKIYTKITHGFIQK